MRCCPKEPAARSHAAFIKMPAMLPVRSPAECLPFSSASTGSVVFGCAGRAGRKTSSRLLQSLRTYAASRSSSTDRRHSPWRALRKRRIHQYQCVEAGALSGRTASKVWQAPQCPRPFGDFCNETGTRRKTLAAQQVPRLSGVFETYLEGWRDGRVCPGAERCLSYGTCNGVQSGKKQMLISLSCYR